MIKSFDCLSRDNVVEFASGNPEINLKCVCSAYGKIDDFRFHNSSEACYSWIKHLSDVLSQHRKMPIRNQLLSSAAVMMLLYPERDEYSVVLHKRSNFVTEHKGEIAFPGGRVEPEDNSRLCTALRETFEEMGVTPADVLVLGELDDVETISGYGVSPYVGVVPKGYEFCPNPREVDRVYLVPLSVLQDQRNVRQDVRFVEGTPLVFSAYAFDGHLIFGATAKILMNFLDVLWKDSGNH